MNIKKILSFSLSGLLFANSFCMAPQAVNNNNNIVPPAHKSSRTLDFIKNNPKTSAGIAGGSLLVAGVLGAVGYLIYKCATDVPQDYLYKNSSQKLLDNEFNVTADDWFYRLGGTQDDINKYKEQANRFDRGILTAVANPTGGITFIYNQKTENTFDQIDKDVNRCYMAESHVPDNSPLSIDFKSRCRRILKIYYYQNQNVGYTQGWDHVLYMLFIKFAEHPTSQCIQDEEAKIYFVYSKFIKMLNSKFENNAQWKTFYENAYREANKQGIELLLDDSSSQYIDYIPCNIFIKGVLTAGSYLFFDYNHINIMVKIFDIIISDDKFISPKTHDFNAELPCSQLSSAIYRMLATNPGLTIHVHPAKKTLNFTY